MFRGRRQRIALILSTALTAMPAIESAGSTFTWNGGDASFGTMSPGDNWVGGSSPYSAASGTADLVFGFLNPHGYAPTLSGNLDVNSLTFNSASLAYTIVTNGSGFSGILSLEGGGLNDASGNAQVISGATAVSINASQPWNVSGAALTDSTPVNLNTSVLTLNTSVAIGSATFSGALSGSGAAGLTKTGPGSLVLSGSGTLPALLLHGGATQVSSGAYTLNSTAAPFNLNAASLNVSSGATVDWSATGAYAVIDGGGTAIVTGSNSKLKAAGQFDIGASGQGTLMVQNSALATSTGYFIVGDFGGSTGVLNISGGTVTAAEGIVGNFAGANGNATVTGSGSQWTLSNYLGVGGNAQTGAATGLLTISNGGAVTAPITTLYYGNSTININGGTLTTGGISSFQTGNGSIALTNPSSGNALILNGASGTYVYSGGITGTGTLNKSGGSTQILSGTLNNTGVFAVAAGTMIFNGSGSNIGVLTIQGGAANVSAGSLTVSSGGLTVTGGALTVNGAAKLVASGFNEIDGAAGTNLTVTGSTADFSVISGGLDVGSGHTGTFNVLMGAQASTGQLIVPLTGSGSFSIASGGIVSSTSVLLADSSTSGSTGAATISGTNSAWNIGGGLTLGAAGNTGILTANASGGVRVTGKTTFGANIPVNISGGTFTTGGLAGTGGGVFNLTSNPPGGTALTINGATGTNTYSGAIYGAGSMQMSGGSTQVILGQVITTGSITVTSGTLSFNGNQSNSLGLLTILGGVANVSSGSLTLANSFEPLVITGGILNVNGGAVLYPVASETTVDGPGSILNVNSGGQFSSGTLELAAVNDLSSVSLNVSSGGMVNVTALVVAAAFDSSATALVTGIGSTLKVSGDLSLGNTIVNGQDAMGSLSITSGGSVSAASCSFQQAAASVTINGGSLSTGYLTSMGTGDGSINLLANPSVGTALNITDPTATDVNTYSGTITGTGSFQKSGGSTQILSGNINTSANAIITAGTLVFNGSGNNSIGVLSVTGGAANVSAGSLKVTSTGTGLSVTGGTLTVSGGTLDTTASTGSSSNLINGPAGTTLTVTGSTSMFKGGSDLTAGLGQTGTLIVTQNAVASAGAIEIPAVGTGVLSITSGGIVTAGSAYLDYYLGSIAGTMTVSGTGSALNLGVLRVGDTGTGLLAVNASGSVSVTGQTVYYSATVPVNVSGGAFTSGSLFTVPSGSGQINLIADPAGGTALTINGSSGTNSYSGGISGAGSLLKTGGSTQILSGLDTFTGSVQVTGGVLELASKNAFSALVISSGGTTQINGSGNILVVPTLVILPGGTLDITKDSADLPGISLQTLNGLARQGFNNGSWTGTGLTSSSAAADTTHLTAVGVIQNNQSGTALYTASHQFEGVTPGVADILAKYTYYGDTNLDGIVDGSDYSRIDNGYLHSSTLTGWFNGDFNYDGVINGSDYTLIDNAFNTQGAQLSAEIATPMAQLAGSAETSVPEPAGLGVVVICTLSSLGRRIRRRAGSRSTKQP